MKNKGLFAIFRKMVNYTKKWWLLGCLRRAEKIHSTTGSATGHRVLVSQKFFIEGNTEWLGLAHKSSPYTQLRFSRIFLFWKKEYSAYKLKTRINDYNDIYEVCFRDGYIIKEKDTNFPSVSTPKAYKIRGFPLGYFHGLFEEYDKVWIHIITIFIALTVAIIGLIDSFFARIFVGK